MKVFIILSVIFVAVFLLIILTRLILVFLINQAHERYKKLKKISNKIINKKKFLKEEDELFLKRNEIPRAHSAVKAELQAKRNKEQSNSYSLIASEEKSLEDDLNQTSIVDIVKPIGFWTSMILGQKLTYLIQSAQIINKRDKQGFWVSMIEAKERAAGRQHGRGR